MSSSVMPSERSVASAISQSLWSAAPSAWRAPAAPPPRPRAFRLHIVDHVGRLGVGDRGSGRRDGRDGHAWRDRDQAATRVAGPRPLAEAAAGAPDGAWAERVSRAWHGAARALARSPSGLLKKAWLTGRLTSARPRPPSEFIDGDDGRPVGGGTSPGPLRAA